MLHLLPPVQQETARQGFCMLIAGLSGVLHSQQPPSRLKLKSDSFALAAKPAGIDTQCELKQLWRLHFAGLASTQARAMRYWLLWLGGADLISRASKRPLSASDQGHPSLRSTRTALKSMWLMVCQSKQVCLSLLCCTYAIPNYITKVPYQLQLLVQVCDAAVVVYICVISHSLEL